MNHTEILLKAYWKIALKKAIFQLQALFIFNSIQMYKFYATLTGCYILQARHRTSCRVLISLVNFCFPQSSAHTESRQPVGNRSICYKITENKVTINRRCLRDSFSAAVKKYRTNESLCWPVYARVLLRERIRRTRFLWANSAVKCIYGSHKASISEVRCLFYAQASLRLKTCVGIYLIKRIF